MKYLEGNIFINFYIFGAAGLLAVLLSGWIYKKWGLKISYYSAFFMSILGCIGMFLIQIKFFKFENQGLRDTFDERLMPVLILIMKMGIITGFIITT
jgi:hypothetical protein